MKKLALILLLPLAACATVPTATQVANAPSYCATQIVMDDKGMVALETLYNVPAHAYVAADTRGQLSAEVKARVKPVLIRMYEYLKKARAAKSVGDAVSFACAASFVESDNKMAVSLLPKG